MGGSERVGRSRPPRANASRHRLPRAARAPVTLERLRRHPMHRRMPDLFEQWLPARPALLAALGIWLAAFALAGANAWRMHHKTVNVEETNGSPVSVADPDDLKGAVVMPEDVIVGLSTPRIGVTLPQKP